MRFQTPTYTLLDEMTASPTAPMTKDRQVRQLTIMWEGLQAIETAATPNPDHWRVCSDAVNMMETMVEMGVIEDSSGLLLDAVTGLAIAGKRAMRGEQIRLDGPGIRAVRAVLEDYATVIEHLSARTMVRCHRRTEKRIREILAGRKQKHDIEVVNL